MSHHTTLNTTIGLSQEQRQGVCTNLNPILADLAVLYTKTKNYHWLVTGKQFHALHTMFQDQYKALAEHVDEVAERIRMLGEQPIGTMREFLDHTDLGEEPGACPMAPVMVTNLLADHEHIIAHLRQSIETCEEQFNDPVTGDFLTGLVLDHEKIAWKLRAFADSNES
jgi:starvation-inducible DNA-binding protein